MNSRSYTPRGGRPSKGIGGHRSALMYFSECPQSVPEIIRRKGKRKGEQIGSGVPAPHFLEDKKQENAEAKGGNIDGHKAEQGRGPFVRHLERPSLVAEKTEKAPGHIRYDAGGIRGYSYPYPAGIDEEIRKRVGGPHTAEDNKPKGRTPCPCESLFHGSAYFATESG